MLTTIPTRLLVVIDELILKLIWKATSPRQAQQSTVMIEKYQVGGITLPNFTGQIISSQTTEYLSMSLKILYGETAIILHFRRCDEVRNLERKSSTWSICMHLCILSRFQLCNPTDCSLSGSSVRGIFQAKNTGVGCHILLQGIFPTQGSNPGRQILYPWATREALVYMNGL